jgi:hypothetical protein
MEKLKIKIGDVFLIPYQKQFAVCKVLWISKRTKNVFSFTVKNTLLNENEEALNIILNKNNAKVKLFTGVVEVFYTDIKKLQNGNWKIIGNFDLDDQEQNNLLYHNIGGKLFKGDVEIRSLNNEEIKVFPKMLVAGYEAIDNFLKMVFN